MKFKLLLCHSKYRYVNHIFFKLRHFAAQCLGSFYNKHENELPAKKPVLTVYTR